MRKTLLISLTLILATAIAYLGYSILQKDKQEEILQNQISRIPDFELRDVDGNFHSLEKLASNKPVLLVYFNSTCEICQIELKSISERILEFEFYQMIFITVQTAEEIDDFVINLGLDQKEDVLFLVDSEMEVAGYYGVKAVPTLFIYDSMGSLIYNFTGPVKVDLILDKLEEGKELDP